MISKNEAPLLTSESVYQDILSRIISLDLYPGEKISENQLAKEYKVSRSIIRHAFIRLMEIGFLEVVPNRGTYVTLIKLDYIEDILLLRTAVEKEIIKRIIESGENKKILETLEKNLNEQKVYEDSESYIEEFKILDRKFHQIISSAANVKNYEELLSSHGLHLSRWRNLSVTCGNSVDKLIEQHETILNALKKSDIKAARRAVELHLDTITEDLIRDISKMNNDYLL